jgi:hypothetical protein
MRRGTGPSRAVGYPWRQRRTPTSGGSWLFWVAPSPPQMPDTRSSSQRGTRRVPARSPRSHLRRSKTSLSLAPGGIISNFHREDAKNAKKALGELVHFLFPSRSWRLRGERLNLLRLVALALARSCARGTSARPCTRWFNSNPVACSGGSECRDRARYHHSRDGAPPARPGYRQVRSAARFRTLRTGAM